jgi:hypothetical protein
MNMKDLKREDQIVKRFIAMYLPPDGETIIVADGGDGPVVAQIEVLYCTDEYIELEISTNLPEWATLRRIYDYYRAKDMTDSERKERAANEFAASRYKELVAGCARLFASHMPNRIQVAAPKSPRVSVNERLRIIQIDEVQLGSVDYYDCLIVKALVKAKGTVMSRREMQHAERALEIESRIDRRVTKLKATYNQLDAIIEVVNNKGYRIRPDMFE